VTVDPIVASTNAAADQLKADGADIVVMLVHEGAPGTDCATMDDDPTSDFGSIIHGVNANVDAIISGHTHLAYNCKFPVTGWENRAVTERPVVSAGQYGAALNQLEFQVDETGAVTGIAQKLLNLKQGQTPLYDADAEVAGIVADAVAEADVLGAVKIGDIAGGFNRAKLADNSTENRGAESTLGNLVAEVQRAQTPETVGGAQIAFMNPGGLRADMVGTGTGAFPRELTYKQAATVQPFANTLVNMDLTGAQLKQALEQQWQPTGASRPFLRLGASEGFTYTYDPDAAAGSRITGMWLDGDPVEPGESFSVTVNSFLSTGGDNFGAFAGGSNKQDTGVTDLQAMVDYMEATTGGANPPLPVDSSQRAVGVNFPAGAPATYAAGEQIAFGLTSLSMTGPGDVTDTSVSVSLQGVQLGTAPVTTTKQTALPGFDEVGTASVAVTVPDDVASGPATLVVTGTATGTEVLVPVTLEAAEEPEPETTTTTLGLDPATVKVKSQTSTATATVSAESGPASGTVEFYVGTQKVGQAALIGGSASFVLGPFATVGDRQIEARYLATATTVGSSDTAVLSVVKRKPQEALIRLSRT
jgi:5'-nucleotidase